MNAIVIPGLADRHATLELLSRWTGQGWLRPLDLALARFFADLDPQASPLLLLAAALVSHQLGQGHVCLDFGSTLANPDFALSLPPEGRHSDAGMVTPSELLAGVDTARWLGTLAGSPLVGPAAAGVSPLVLSGQALYLRRYWHYESSVAGHIASRIADPLQAPPRLAQRLDVLFPAQAGTTDWQKVACALAASGRFSLITGGPGTGKTTTVVKLLALLQEAALDDGVPLRLSLAAPTGKAAARLTESIGAQVRDLPVSEAVRERIPTEVTTVHRLLGRVPNSRRFRHHAGHKLSLDVLVVDEASMIDLEMMAHLLDALPDSARLILLGDKDQLASVEAGAVLGDLCRDAEHGHYSPATIEWLDRQGIASLEDPALQPGDASQHLAQHTVMLRRSRRFGHASGIGRLARAVNAGHAVEAEAILRERPHDLQHLACQGPDDPALDRLLLDGHEHAPGYAAYLQRLQQRPADEADNGAWLTWAADILQSFDHFRLLAAVRKGPWGVEQLNLRITHALQRRGLLSAGPLWYEGRPVMVTRNDYSLGLMNGDVGITLRLPVPDGEGRHSLRVVFPRNDGSGALRLVLPSRLGAVETVFAMTVHKSQGSEFAHTALILPDSLSPVLTRELIYTGITRARGHFSLIETRSGLFQQAVQRQVLRRSGLRRLIGG
ncbi:exodeoxyribonuclease V subunit alpha [Frateuria aurantia]